MITSSSQRSIPTTVKSGCNTLQNRRSVKLLDYSSDISGYHADFHEALSEQGRGAAWHVWINERRGMGTSWAQHAMCESALILPITVLLLLTGAHSFSVTGILLLLPLFFNCGKFRVVAELRWYNRESKCWRQLHAVRDRPSYISLSNPISGNRWIDRWAGKTIRAKELEDVRHTPAVGWVASEKLLRVCGGAFLFRKCLKLLEKLQCQNFRKGAVYTG